MWMSHHESSGSDAAVILKLQTSLNFVSVCVMKPAAMATVLFKERSNTVLTEENFVPHLESHTNKQTL